jgi:MFS family permease
LQPRATTTRNLLAIVGPELLWGFGSALTIEGPMPAAFAQHLGAGEAFLGAWFLVGSLSIAVAMLATGWYVPSLAKKRRIVAWGHTVTGALYLPVGLLTRWAEPLGPAWSQAAALLGLALFMMSLGFLMPAWVALIGELFPEGRRARVMGLVFVVNRLGGIAGGLAAAHLLALPWAGRDTWTLLWGLAAATATLGSLPLLAVVEPDVERQPRPRFGAHLRSLVHTFTELPAFRRFVALDLLAVSGFVTVAFYGDLALRERGLPQHWSGIWIAATAAAQLAGALAITAWGGRILPVTSLAWGAVCIGAASVLACVAREPVGFVAVAVLCGLYAVARQTSQGPQVMRLAPGREPTHPLALAMAVTSSVQALLPFAAGLLLPSTGFLPVFAAVALTTLSAAWLLPRRVSGPPPGIPAGVGTRDPGRTSQDK